MRNTTDVLIRLKKTLQDRMADETMLGEQFRYYRAGLRTAISAIEDEIDAPAEREFLRPIKPADPVAAMVNG